MKSYSKTKPLRVEEFEPIADWWGKESDGFAARIESEQAWKIDFKKLKEEAEAKAQPHWDKAESLNNEAAALTDQIKELRDSIKGEKKETERKKVEDQIQALNEQIETLRQQAKDEQAIRRPPLLAHLQPRHQESQRPRGGNPRSRRSCW